MTQKGTKLIARIYKTVQEIRNIQMSKMSLQKNVLQVQNSLNGRPQGGLTGDTEPKLDKQHEVINRIAFRLQELDPKKRDTEVSTKKKSGRGSKKLQR